MRNLILLNLLLSVMAMAHSLVDINVSTLMPKQGEAVWVRIKSYKQLSAGNIKLGKKSFKLFKQANAHGLYNYVSCIGISRYMVAGDQKLTFKISFKDHSYYQTELKLDIKSANYRKEFIKLKPKKYKLSQDKVRMKKETRIIGKKFRKISTNKKYDGPFLWPVTGRISSEFGMKRVYNNRPGWSHSGVDISADVGVPIKASQSGEVILAKLLNIHGNTVMIDHGWGIISIYNHLNKINVKLTDNIKKGDIIGEVGSTGIATGAHLHFGISIQGTRVDPQMWVKTTSYINI